MITTSSPKLSLTLVIVGIMAIIFLTAIPLVIVTDSEFSGSDSLGAETITHLAPAYNSEWSTNWWVPPGGETESALFALQAAFGGVLIGYCFGYLKGRKTTNHSS